LIEKTKVVAKQVAGDISLTLNYYEKGVALDIPDKTARCFVSFDDMVLSISCGLWGAKEPLDYLEQAVKVEFSSRAIALSNLLVERRPG